MDLSSTVQSAPTDTRRSSPSHTSPPPHYNPYTRMPSRRAIACVTCAKAKTKCDKALPACSRCITKGITCEPRSTRRTSDNSYRANIKKPFVSPKLYHPSSTVPALGHVSPRSMPTATRPTAMRPASHIDFRTVVKMSQQASGISGYPMLTPLPTYASQIVDECYSYTSSPEQHLEGFPTAVDMNGMPLSGRSTPQTPESTNYPDPIAMRENMNYMASQQWTDEAMAQVGLGFDSDIEDLQIWSTPEPENMMPMAHLAWPPPAPSVSPQQMLPEVVAQHTGVSSLVRADGSIDDFTGNRNSWSMYQPTGNQISKASMATPAHLMQSMKPMPAHAPIWEDVFIPGSSPY